MADEDFLLLPPDEELAKLGATKQDVEQYPPLQNVPDTLHCAAADACRKALVGEDGTNLQMIDVISVGNNVLVAGQVCLFLVKNKIKPMAKHVAILAGLVELTAERLGSGSMHAVNRRRELTNNGVLKPTGDDIVPDSVRALWITIRNDVG